MIISRYLTREMLQTTFAVTLVLILIMFSARFSSYLADAATGRLDAGVLFTLLGLRMFNYLELILPLGMLIGILLAHGRLYVDSEMTVLFACGMSQNQLLGHTLKAAVLVAFVVGIFSFYLGPIGIKLSQQILLEQRNRTDFEAMRPGKFTKVSDGEGVTYAESISADKKKLNAVFLAKLDRVEEQEIPVLITAQTGTTIIEPQSGGKFLQLSHGRRYVGRPGELDFEVVEFDSFAQRLPEPDYEMENRKATDASSTLTLLRGDSPVAHGALHWRLSMPVLVLVLALLAVPLSRTQPRAGRYAKLLPAVLAYVLYLFCLNSAREAVETGASVLLMWLVHASFVAVGWVLFARESIQRMILFRRP